MTHIKNRSSGLSIALPRAQTRNFAAQPDTEIRRSRARFFASSNGSQFDERPLSLCLLTLLSKLFISLTLSVSVGWRERVQIGTPPLPPTQHYCARQAGSGLSSSVGRSRAGTGQ